MDNDITRATQRSTSNLYAFRRLKWGSASKRFRLLANPTRNAIWLSPAPTPEAPSTDSVLSQVQEGPAPIIPLQPRPRPWPLLELFLIAVIAASVVIIALQLLR